MDSGTAALIGAAIGLVGGLGGTLITTGHQWRMARVEHRRKPYLDALLGLQLVQDSMIDVLYENPRTRTALNERDVPNEGLQLTRASVAVFGSKEVRVRFQDVRDGVHEWEKLIDAYADGPDGQGKPLDSVFWTTLEARYKSVSVAVTAIAEQMNAELHLTGPR